MKGGDKVIAIGCSSGGFEALCAIVGNLPASLSAPVLIVSHTAPDNHGLLASLLNDRCSLEVCEAEDKEAIQKGHVYVAPPGYHLLIERDLTLSLSLDPRVTYSRPSIDVLFETAAEAYGSDLIAVVLTGANEDGSTGLKTVSRLGGMCVAQNPETATVRVMPDFAIATGVTDAVIDLDDIAAFLVSQVGDAA